MRTFTGNDEPVDDFIIERRFPYTAYNKKVINI